MTTTATDMFNRATLDPSVSYFLKEAMTTLARRDPVDAIQDVECLLEWATLRLDEIQGR